MTSAAPAKQTDKPVAKLPARRHKWGDSINIYRDTSPSGCDESEKPCTLCGLVKITVHPPIGPYRNYPYRAFRSKGGIRFLDPGYTPVCDGEVK